MKKLSNKEIVILLRITKVNYINDIKTNLIREGLCHYISETFYQIYDKDIMYVDIQTLIPKFNHIFCKGDSAVYWWPTYYTESRIKALDKLIEYYSCNNIIDKIKFYIKWYIK